MSAVYEKNDGKKSIQARINETSEVEMKVGVVEVSRLDCDV
jgi:hypothetical protein